MKTLEIQGSIKGSTIRVGEKLQNLGNYIPEENVVIITDVNVKRFYQNKFPPHPLITVQTGEKIKTLDTVRNIYGKLGTSNRTQAVATARSMGILPIQNP